MSSEHLTPEPPAFLAACQGGDTEVAAALLRQSLSLAFATDVEGNGGVTGLWLAAEGGHTGVVVAILKALQGDAALVARALTHAREPEHVTPLYVACQNGHAATAAALCKALCSFCDKSTQRAVLNAAKATGATPVYIAAQQGYLPVLQTLLGYGADPDQATGKGLTPLMIAAYQSHATCVEALLAAHADPSRRTPQGRDAQAWAGAGAVALGKQPPAAALGNSETTNHAQVQQLLSQALREKEASAIPTTTALSPPVPDIIPAPTADSSPPPANRATGPATDKPVLTRDEIAKVNADWVVFRERIAQEAKML